MDNNLKSKVVSFELAKRMKELGWKKETEFYWIDVGVDKIEWIIEQSCFLMPDISTCPCEHYPAPLFCEVWEELPSYIEDKKYYILGLWSHYQHKEHYVAYCDNYPPYHNCPIGKFGITLAEAAGEMWCWDRENGYIEGE